MADVEMKPADIKPNDDEKKEEKEDKKEEKKDEPKKEPESPVTEIKSNAALIEKAVATLEPRFTHRVLRTLAALRKRLDDSVLRKAIEEVYPKGAETVRFHRKHSNIVADSSVKITLLSWLPPAPTSDQEMEIDSTTPAKPPPEPVPEVEIYLRLLIIHHLLKSPDYYAKAIELAHQTVEKMQALNRRSMDPIAAKIWFAVERAYEFGGEIADARP